MIKDKYTIVDTKTNQSLSISKQEFLNLLDQEVKHVTDQISLDLQQVNNDSYLRNSMRIESISNILKLK